MNSVVTLESEPVEQEQTVSVPSHGADLTYYDRPVIKPPVWIWSIPAYFYAGGLAGAAMVMGLAAQLFGDRRLRSFEERCRWTGAAGGGVGTALLIWDLGRRERFLYMLRVFRPTSPMSVGSWILALATPLSAGSALLTFSKGRLYRVGQAAGIGAGVLGLPLSCYTAVLISNTAVPLWQASRRRLPWLFAASSVASLASLFELMALNRRETALIERFGAVGRVAELAAGALLERDAERVPQVGRPLHTGLAGALWKTARVATLASLAISLLPGNSRGRRIVAGVLGTVGGVCLRFAVVHGGKMSAMDPRATFRQQRGFFG
jgi:formate-dependent nitrite reductase membrane component NrfD